MRLRRLVLAAALSLASLRVYAADAQNTARGLSPTGASHDTEIENVSLFNGGLTVHVPIAPSYPLNGGASYSIGLVYTGQPWDFPRVQAGSPGVRANQAVPNRRSNAGLGWRVSIGRLILPNDPTNVPASSAWKYESPDGADHVFYTRIHPTDAITDTPTLKIFYTRDNTYLRLRQILDEQGSTQYLELDFPDGVTHRFDATGKLAHIRTAFSSPSAPDVTVTDAAAPSGVCGNDTGASTCWTLTDSFGRNQYVSFEADSNLYLGRRARKLMLAGAQDKTLTYSLVYADNGTSTLYTDDSTCYTVEQTPPSYSVPLLQSVTLPDGSSYVFQYYNAIGRCDQGSLSSVTLPTGGAHQFTYQNYALVLDPDSSAPAIAGLSSMTKNGGTWTYTPTVAGSQTYLQNTGAEYTELMVTVTNPDSSVVKNYFSIAKHSTYDNLTVQPWKASEYGLPLTHRPESTWTDGNNVTRYLSTETLASSTGPLLRRAYVVYETDGNTIDSRAHDDNRRVVSAVTTFNADGGRYVATDFSLFDGFGHYRRSVTTSAGFQMNTPKTTTRNFTPQVDVSSRWLLKLFDYESVSDGTTEFRSDACFDASGFLTRTRRRASNAPAPGVGPDDVINVYSPSAGNVAIERTYSESMSDLCGGTPSSSPVVDIRHTYSNGVRATSTYYDSAGQALPFKVLDADLDPIGVTKSSRDVAGRQTAYVYDDSSRLKTVTPPATGASAMAYSYANATTTTPATVTQTQNDQTTTLTYDGFGRLIKEARAMPGGQTAIRTTSYDLPAREYSVSQWEYSTPTHFTTFTSDIFGRVVTAQLPDGKAVRTIYTGNGVAEVTRVSAVATSGANPDAEQSTTETYDAFGRLIKVTEPSGNVTTYGYDAADHLIAVCVNVANCQNRTFTYDGRGFMVAENHPENGVTKYFYDARGRVIYKQIGVAPSDRDLVFTYDAAERLGSVARRVSGSGVTCGPMFLTCEPLKDFVYGTTPGYGLGRLRSATRHNWDGASDLTVKETYDYDSGGRVSNITTDIARNGTPLKALTSPTDFVGNALYGYDGVGNVTVINYPVCVAGCGVSSSGAVAQTWSNGFLTSVPTFADISRAANGMVTSVAHKTVNGAISMTDTYAEDLNKMPRPLSIEFSPYAACTPPQISAQPTNQTAANGAATLTVTAPNASYQWYSVAAGTATALSGETSPILHLTGVAQTRQYYVAVYNSCGRVLSNTVTVTVSNCPSIVSISQDQTIAANQSVALTVTANGDSPFHYQWYRGAAPDNSNPVGTDASTYTTPGLTVTTRYWVSITNNCGTSTSSATITITVPLAKPLLFQATASVVTQPNVWQVSLTWQASSGAAKYRLYRLADGQSDFTYVRDVMGLSDTDTIVAGTARAYYVVAVDAAGGSPSPASDRDLATAVALTQVASTGAVYAADFDRLLSGVNAIRAATGHAPVTWASILPPGIPVPGRDVGIYAAQLASVRGALDTARGFIPGLPSFTYVNPVSGDRIAASHVNLLIIGGMQ